MSHKGKVNAASSTKSKKLAKSSVESKTENALQAVILADSFQDRFRPFTIKKPRCLLPLANTPLIEYTLEFLAMNGVDEVFIYCGSHTDQVEEYIGRSRWSTASRTCPFTVLQFVRVSNAQSVGDVLRDLDKRSLVDGNFLLVHGDLVSNLMLDGALAEHRKRVEVDPANIMTIILRSGGENAHRTKTNGISPVFVIDVPTKRILHYQEIYALQSKRYIDLDPALLDELSTDFEVRSDLIDAQVDICTPEVLALWSESFDYALPRKNFLHGVLKDWELNGKKINTEIVSQDYAARASSLQMYDAISHDVLNRWTYPLIPENNYHPDMSYQRHDNGLVMERSAKHAPDALLANSVVGGGSIVGPTCRISNSVIGRGCHIGASVVIENSFIWDNTTIKDGTRILHSILGDSVVVGKDCLVSAGSLISFGVQVSDGISLRENTVLSTVTSSGNAVDADTTLLGPSTNAAHFVDLEDEIDDDDPTSLQKTLLHSLASLNISASSISELGSDDVASYGDATLEPAVAAVSTRSRLSSFASDDSSGKLSFHHDAVHGLMDAMRAHSGDFNSAKVEFMGLRLASNASDAMLRKAVATAFARRVTELTTAEHGALEPRRAADGALTARPGAARFIGEVGVGDGGVADQVEFVLALQRALWLHPVASDRAYADDSALAGTLLAAMLQKLYALDVLEEDGILGWWEDGRAVEGEGMAVLRNKCRMLVEWLENASEEDDEDDE